MIENKLVLTGFEKKYILKNGKIKTLLFSGICLIGSNGEVIGIQGTAIDITDRLVSKQALKDSES